MELTPQILSPLTFNIGSRGSLATVGYQFYAIVSIARTCIFVVGWICTAYKPSKGRYRARPCYFLCTWYKAVRKQVLAKGDLLCGRADSGLRNGFNKHL